MNTLLRTQHFDAWLAALRDTRARAKIIRRLERAAQGNLGDHKNIDGPIWEMRIDYGPGYRLYYAQKGNTIYVLLCGGNKTTQQTDINLAKQLWSQQHGD